MLRDPQTGSVLGLAGQDLFSRSPGASQGAKNARRRDVHRESAVWGRVIDRVGQPPEGVKWLHVCDRGADDYEVFLRTARQGCGWVIRACRLNRLVQDAQGDELS